MKTLVIVNPAAGHGRGRKRWAKLASSLRGLDAAARFTSRPGEASELALRALGEGFEAIVAFGGDGTLGEVVDGYLSAPEDARARTALGCWPAGSGSDTARHFELGNGAGGLGRLLREPKLIRVDAGRVSFQDERGRPAARHFVNVVTLGLGGEVARRVARSGKPLGGTITYLASSIASIARAKPYSLSLVVDGVAEAPAPYHLVAVANTSSTGGGMKIAPSADACDGRFDVVTVGDMPRAALLRRLPLVYAGKHLGQPGVHHRLARRLEVRSDRTAYLNIDGEAVGALPAVFEMMPGAVPFLT